MPKSIHQEVDLKAGPKRIYEAFMSSKEHGAFTGGPAEIDASVGGAFSCHGGRVVGRNVELVPGRRIVQAWRGGDWPEGVYSIVKFELSENGGGTKLVMDHDGVPDSVYPQIEGGWPMIYWEPMKKYFN